MKLLFIPIKPNVFTGNTAWESKRESVILVKKKTDIEPLYKLLCEQDNYWLNHKNLIQVAPK